MKLKAAIRIMELEALSSRKQLHRAYRRQVKRWHPDQFAHRPDIRDMAEEHLKELNQAYEFLIDHLQNHQALAGDSNPNNPEAANDDEPDREDETEACFNWKQWFKTTIHQYLSRRNGLRDRSRNRNGSATANNTDRPRFERVLREAAKRRPSVVKVRSTGARLDKPAMTVKRRSKKIRIEGFAPPSPITPVKPISRIGRIGDNE